MSYSWRSSITSGVIVGLAVATGLSAWWRPGATARAAQSAQTPRETAGARVLEGAIDLHFHMEAPAQAGRGGQGDIVQIRTAKARGLRGLVLKTHNEPTGTLAYHLRLAVPDFALFGGVVMNRSNGGMNPAAVEYMAGHTAGLGRIVWMPAGDTEFEVRASKAPNGPFVRVAAHGALTPETMDVLKTIATNERLILASGHIPADETLLVFTEARRLGVRHMIATHAMDIFPGEIVGKMSIEQMRKAAQMGAFIEFDMRNIFHDDGVRADAIKAIGPEYCFISEFWTNNNPRIYGALDDMGTFVEKMKAKGFTDGDLDLMFKTNPAKLLGL